MGPELIIREAVGWSEGRSRLLARSTRSRRPCGAPRVFATYCWGSLAR